MKRLTSRWKICAIAVLAAYVLVSVVYITIGPGFVRGPQFSTIVHMVTWNTTGVWSSITRTAQEEENRELEKEREIAMGEEEEVGPGREEARGGWGSENVTEVKRGGEEEKAVVRKEGGEKEAQSSGKAPSEDLSRPQATPSAPQDTPATSRGQTDVFDEEMVGKLNYDVWKLTTGYLVDDLRIKRDFPNNPDVRSVTESLQVTFDERDPADIRGKYAHKIYGYLQPQETGRYVFRIVMRKMTAACTVELWLSSNANPTNIQKLVEDGHSISHRRKEAIQTHTDSSPINLQSGHVYYLEFLEKAFDGRVVVELQWKPPSGTFRKIPPSSYAMVVKLDDHGGYVYSPVVKVLQGPLPSNKLQAHRRVQFIGDTVYPITDLNVLPLCAFSAAYAYPHALKRRFASLYQVFYSKVYPPDETSHGASDNDPTNKPDSNTRHEPNPQVQMHLVEKVLSMYKEAFQDSKEYSGNVELRYLEETENKPMKGEYKGSRFLLELDIQLDNQDTALHTSEYVYLPSGSNELCHTENFQWTKDVDVHVVVSLKNLGLWTKHLIHNMEHIYQQTHDDHFELIIVDYASQDVDAEAELRKSSLKRWKVIHKKGQFSRSAGLQAGLDYVQDLNSIVMTIDMHLAIPPGFIEYTRRHIVKGKMAFAPFFFRLGPGFTEVNIEGSWEIETYGLFGMYKSDWMTIGGFDVEKYTNKWGGEDWDILDKVISKGFEVFRIRYPGLMHYFHTRARMWGNKTT